MQNQFSLKRTWLLIQGEWAEKKSAYFYGTLSLIGLLTIMMLWWVNFTNGYRDEQLFIMYVFGLLAVCGFAINSFNKLRTKPGAVHWLMQPATPAEKLTCAFFFNILNVLIFTVCFILVAGFALWYLNEKGAIINKVFTPDSPKEVSTLWNFFFAFLAMLSFYQLGSVYFKKYAIGLTTIIGILSILAFVYCLQTISHSFHGMNTYFLGDKIETYNFNTHSRTVIPFNNHFVSILMDLFKIIWMPFFLLVTWFRIKEKEI